MAVNLSPFGPKPQFELADGTPAVGNKLFFYVAGSVNTKQTTYTDSTGGSANPNPIILNSLGQPPNQIWFTAGQSYKVVYAPSTDTDPPTSPIWTVDNIMGINDTTVTIDEWIASGLTPTFVSAVSFTLVGDQTTEFHVGRRLQTTNSGGTIYSTIASSVFGAVTTVTVVNDSGTLDSGLSAVWYGINSAANTSLPVRPDVVPVVSGTTDRTKRVRFEADGLTTATVRVITVPDRDITLGSAANAQVGTYTVDGTDYGKVVTCSGTFTLNLTAAATLGSGWWCWVKNIGTGVITLDGATTELIFIPGGSNAGDQTMTLPYSGSTTGPYNVSGVLIWCNGTGFQVLATAETHGSELKTTTGTDSWTVPAGVTTVWVTGCAAGGGGGAASAGTNSGGGGGGGESAISFRVAVVPGASLTRTIGVGGTGGVNGGAAATAGGNSVFSTLTLVGGGGGVADGAGGAGGSGTAIAGTPGGSGSAAGGISFAAGGGGSCFGQGAAAGVGGGQNAGGRGAGGGARGNAAGNGGNGSDGFILIEW